MKHNLTDTEKLELDEIESCLNSEIESESQKRKAQKRKEEILGKSSNEK